MNTRYFLILLFCVSLLGCEEEEKPNGKYEEGVIVVNEGGFNASNGTITHYDKNSAVAEQNIFSTAGSQFAGDVVQSLTINNNTGYIVVNDDNKIEVVDARTFEGINTITHEDIVKPRYVEVIGSKAYITVWGPYDDDYSLIDSYVLVYDLESDEVIQKIDTDEGVEKLLYNGHRLFASNYNFGGSSTVAVIDPADDTLVDQIELSAGPSGMVIDNNGKLWVIATGNQQANDGKLFRINPNTLAVETEIDLAFNPGTDLEITGDKKNLIFTAGTWIYKMPVDATSAPTEAFIEADEIVAQYGIGLDPDNGDIYIADALNYATTGKVYVYSADGTLKTSFPAGISPTQFVFK